MFSDEFIVSFWELVSIKGQDECWNWNGRLYPGRGYGSFRNIYPHKIAYIIKYGPIPFRSKVICRCGNKACCNPNHLTTRESEDYFFSRKKVDEKSGCWNWTGGKFNTGYGSVFINGRLKVASRVAYEFRFGPIPNGKLICHKCDNRACINPDHLFVGTHLDNLVDCHQKDRCYGKINYRISKVIKSLYESGIPICSISLLVGISESQVGRVINKKAWFHGS